MHLSKTHWDGQVLLVNVINQTAGIFGGDAITTRVVVESGARVLLSSPSASRFHPSRGREARLEQHFRVCAGASLDVFPELCIPQRDSRSRQQTRIDLEPGAELLYLETLAPGRVASDEAFAFEQYSWSTDVRLGERLILRERAAICPETSSVAGLRAFFSASYYAGFVLVSPAAHDWGRDFQVQISEQRNAGLRIAATRLDVGAWAVRLLAVDSLSVRRAIGCVRSLLYERLGRKPPDPRRTAC